MFKTKNSGFTLIEVMIVIVIIGVLAAMIMITGTSSSDKSKEVSCASDIHVMKTDYIAHNIDNEGFKTALGEVLAKSNRNVTAEINDGDAIVTGICKSGGTYIITPDMEGDSTESGDAVDITCTYHSTGYNISVAKVILEKMLSIDAVKKYFMSTSARKKSGTSIDSTGQNFAPLVLKALAEQLHISNMDKYAWRIVRTAASTGKYENDSFSVYISQTPCELSSLPMGATVAIYACNMPGGSMTEAVAKVGGRWDGKQTIKYLQY